MEPIKFVAYIEVEGTSGVSTQQIYEAICGGLRILFYHDPNLPKFDVAVHRTPTGEELNQVRAGMKL